MHVQEGSRFGERYVLGPLLGAGGAARVYRAHDERLGVPVALKVLTHVTPTARARLQQEASVQAALRHPHVVAVTDTLEVGTWPALVMELVEGPTLEELIATAPLPLPEALDLYRGVLEGVAAAHARGLVHRDLKPGNILVARVGRRLIAKVTDFGLAKVLVGGVGTTRTGAIMGTPRYMAPEQVLDSKQVDTAADVWALGAILYELVTGRPAFDGEETLAVFNRIAQGAYTPLPPDVDPVLAALITDALSVDPALRPPTVEAMQERLGEPTTVSFSGDVLARWTVPGPLSSPPDSGEMTWSASLVATPASAPPRETASDTVPEPPPRPAPTATPRLAGLLGGLVVMALVGVGLVAGRPGTVPEAPGGFMVGAAPTVPGDAAAERMVGLVWHAIESDLGDARGMVEQAWAQGERAPALALLGAYLAFPIDAEGVDRFLGGAFQSTPPGPPDPVADLLHRLQDGHRDATRPDWWVPALRAHLERWPEDRLAALWLLRARAARPEGELDPVDVARVIDPAPASLGGRMAVMTAYRSFGRFEEAEAQGLAALAAGHRSAAVRSELAITAQQLGKHREAIEHGVEALRIEPGAWPPRLHAAMSAAHLGDMETFERLVAPMRDDASPVADRRRFAYFVARGLATLGQLERSAEWAAHARAAAVGSDAQQTLVRIAAMEVTMRLHPWVGADDDLAERLVALDREVADPTLAPEARHDAGMLSVLGHGVLAARSGDLPAARRALGRLEGEAQERLAVALARADGAPLPAVTTCWGHVTAATTAMERGLPDEATTHAAAALAGCENTDSQPFALAQAVQAERGEPGAAQAFARTWPAPDPELPVAKRRDGWPGVEGTVPAH